MKINREEFLDDLNMVKGGLSAREFIEQSSCFVFQDGQVMTFNDEVACRKDIGINVTGAVQATSLLEILGKLPDKVLLVRENDKAELEFRGKNKGFGVTKDAEIFLPIDKVEKPKSWRPLSKKLIEAIGLVRHCISSDESRFILTCIHLTPDFVQACDNFQILRHRVDTGLEESVLVRGTSLQEITQLAMVEIATTKSWIHFRNEDGLTYSCRKYAESYPDLDRMLEIKNGHPIVLPKGLGDAAECAAVFASDRSGDPLVKVSLSDGMCRIVGEGLSGWYKEVKEIDYDGPTMTFTIAPELLKNIVNTYASAYVTKNKLKATSGKSAKSGSAWEFVTVLGDPEAQAKEEANDEDATD